MREEDYAESRQSSNKSQMETKGMKTEVFEFKHGKILYSNSQVNDEAEDNDEDNFKVKNYFCTHSDGKMIKTT